MKRQWFKSRTAILAGVLFAMAASAFASSLGGRILDADGVPLPGAQIVLQDLESHASTTLVSGEDGSYSANTLPPGNYVLTVKKQGYADVVQEKVVVGGSDPVTLNLRLRPNREQATVSGTEELNPNTFVVKLDTNEITRQMYSRGSETQLGGEFRPQENNYGAQYGYPLRRVVTARPAAPLKDWHGSLNESFQSSVLDARSFFTVGGLLPSRRNEYGASASGRLWSDKTSLFVAWGQVRDSGFVNGNIQAPTLEERTPRSSDPAVNAVIARLLTAYPQELPNLPLVSRRQLNTNAVREVSSTALSTRWDFRPRRADQIVFEQRFFDSTDQPFELVVGQNPVTLFRPQSYHLSEVHTFSPRTIARFSYNFDRLGVRLDLTKNYLNLMSSLGNGAAPEISFGRNGDLQNLGPGTSFPRRRVENRFYFLPELVHVQGMHTLTAGFLVSRLQTNDLQSDNARGIFEFGANFGRTAVENFLLGLPSNYKITVGGLYRGFRNWEDAVYFHDVMRLRPNFTLSLGVRYEVITVPVEVNGLTAISYHTDANNFAPQFGFAWNPSGGKTAVRGGYGISFGTIFPLLYQRARFNPPDVQVISIDNPNLLNPLAGANLNSSGSQRSGLNLLSPDLVVPYTHVYTLTLERPLPGRLLLRAGYLGSRTFKLPWDVITNRAVPVPGIETSTKTINQRRPDPRYLQIDTIANGAISYFDAFQLSVESRFSKNLTWSARYTFSKAINTGDSTFADIGTGRHVSMDGNIVGDLKGPEAFDTPQAWTVTYQYQLPGLGGQRGVRSLLLGGWKLSGVFTFRSGTPYMVHTGSDAPGFGNTDGVGQDRPDLLNLSILGKSVNHPDTSLSVLRPEFFNTNIPAGGRGNLGFDTFRLDDTNNWNLALGKDFRFRSAQDRTPTVEFRAELYNALNHAQFDAYAPHVANDIFGRITNTVNRGRIIQLMLRLRL